MSKLHFIYTHTGRIMD